MLHDASNSGDGAVPVGLCIGFGEEDVGTCTTERFGFIVEARVHMGSKDHAVGAEDEAII